MPRRPGLRVCAVPGCPTLTTRSRCSECEQKAEQKRGSARQRGYGHGHETRFRPGVLARDPMCVLCDQARSVHADHHPRDRRALVAAGLDPDHPQYGRGLCGPCHSAETAREQPGGWNI
ncbi:holin [Streptomyces sp. NPDC055025]